MLPKPDRLPTLCRKPRKAASMTVLALAIGGAGGLVAAGPASAAYVPPTPTFTSTQGGSLNNGESLIPVLSDLNGDGFRDIVTSGSNGFTVELNNGDGTFGAPTLFASPSSYTIAVGDVNGDGKADVVAASYDAIQVNLGDGNGSFSPAAVGTVAQSNGSYPAPVIGDFNGDGVADLAISLSQGGVDLYSGDGTGTFTYVTSVATSAAFSDNLNAEGADINGDGRTDLVIPQYPSQKTSVLLSDGTAFGFHPEQQYPVGGLSSALVDLNGDGHPDIAHGGTKVGALIYDPLAGTFTDRTAAGSSTAEGVSAADLNGDGLVDLAADQSGNEVAYLNDGAGGFVQSPLSYPLTGAGNSSYGQTAGDLNNDGKADLVVTVYDSNNVVLLNTGNAAPATITDQPNDQTIGSGSTATFVSAATSNTPQTVQWQLSTDGGTTYTNIAGATGSSYTTPIQTTANSGARFRAVYTNYGGAVPTSAATLTVTATIPTAVTDPASQTVDSGQTATFTASATGDPVPTVRWQVSTNGGSSYVNIAGATATTYTTPATTYADNGHLYRAVFTNSAGTDTTAAAYLGVNAAAPFVTNNPNNKTVTSGATATFAAAATGDPTPTVQWQISTDGGANFADINGATSLTYAVATTYADDNNQYRAVFTNIAGATPTTAATLSVNASHPVVTDQPANQTVGSGGTATFTAAATGDPTPTVQWQVSTDAGASFSNLAGATDPTLSITAVFADNANQYRAVFTNPGGSDTSNTASLTVDPAAPVVTTNPQSQTRSPGTSVTFTAGSTGDPTPTVQWQVSTDGGGTYTDLTGETGTSLTLTATTARDQNSYRAVFSNAAGDSPTSGAVLTVPAIAPAVSTQPTDQTVNAGDPVTFTAAGTGDPTPTVQWQISADNGATFTDLTGETNPSYTFTATAGNQGTSYRAVFTNSGGVATSNAATLTVDTAPQVTAQPGDAGVNEGGTATFTAAADGRETPTVQWQVSTDGGMTYADVPGATAVSYSFTPAATDTGNLYRAVFTNSVDTATTNAAELTVHTAPVVTTQPADTTVNEGATASFTAAADGSEAPTVQWQVSTDGGLTFSNIAGATAGTLVTSATTADDTGNLYRAVFTDVAGSATTDAAELTVTPAPVVAPSAPRNVVVTKTGPGQITVTWDPPADEGTSPVTGYDVGYGNGGSGDGRTVGADQRSAVFDGLADGTYTATVTAFSEAGEGVSSNEASVTLLPTLVPPAVVPPAVVPPVTTAGVAPAAASLPRTGSDEGATSALALGLLALGSMFGIAGRRRRRS